MNIKKICSENKPKSQCHKLGPFKLLLMIIFSNSVINGSFLTYATEIIDEPSCFCANFEDNHWPVLWNYGKIKHHSAEGN